MKQLLITLFLSIYISVVFSQIVPNNRVVVPDKIHLVGVCETSGNGYTIPFIQGDSRGNIYIGDRCRCAELDYRLSYHLLKINAIGDTLWTIYLDELPTELVFINNIIYLVSTGLHIEDKNGFHEYAYYKESMNFYKLDYNTGEVLQGNFDAFNGKFWFLFENQIVTYYPTNGTDFFKFYKNGEFVKEQEILFNTFAPTRNSTFYNPYKDEYWIGVSKSDNGKFRASVLRYNADADSIEYSNANDLIEITDSITNESRGIVDIRFLENGDYILKTSIKSSIYFYRYNSSAELLWETELRTTTFLSPFFMWSDAIDSQGNVWLNSDFFDIDSLTAFCKPSGKKFILNDMKPHVQMSSFVCKLDAETGEVADFFLGGLNARTSRSSCVLTPTDKLILTLGVDKFVVFPNSEGIFTLYNTPYSCDKTYFNKYGYIEFDTQNYTTYEFVSTDVFALQAHQPKIYPNPATEFAIVEGVEPESIISIYSLHGVLIQSVVASSGTVILPIAELKQGIYIVQITDTSGVKHSKLSVR